MTERQIEYGFWSWDKEHNFPPESLTFPSEYNGQPSVNIVCTQMLDITATEQKKLVKSWIDFLPNCKKIEMLWFTTHTTQQIFESACKLENLVGLSIKWSNIKTLQNLSKLKKLKYLSIGSSAQIESILPLASLQNLEVLHIENFKRITDFSLLSSLTNLKFLSIEGGMYAKQKVDSYEPIGKLNNLIHFSTTMVSCQDKRIDPILKLKNLKSLYWPFDLSKSDRDNIKKDLQQLTYFNF